MKIKIVFLGLFLMFTRAGCFAQEKPQILINLAQNDGQTGTIDLRQPAQLENLLTMQISNNRLHKGIPGYRISIFSQSGLTAGQRADEAKINFMRNFPEIEAYQEYNSPNFQIFVGDFRTKNEALREMKKIERVFSRAFITPTTINIR